MGTRATHQERSSLQQQWHGWGSPIGMGVGLLCIGGFFALITLGLWLLASIG